MSDFTEQLRAWPACEGHDAFSSAYVGELLKDAADEIDQLRSALEKIVQLREASKGTANLRAGNIARTALTPPEDSHGR